MLKYSVPGFTGILGVIAIILQLTRIANEQWWVSLIGWVFTLYPYFAIYYYYNKYKNEEPESK